MKKYIIIILLILIIIFLVNTNEYYENIENKKKTQSSVLPKIGVRQGSDGLEGQLFEDVLMHHSDPLLDGELGVEKCIKSCKGMCVEYGMTSDAYCFPSDYAEIKDKYTKTIQTELKTSPLQY